MFRSKVISNKLKFYSPIFLLLLSWCIIATIARSDSNCYDDRFELCNINIAFMTLKYVSLIEESLQTVVIKSLEIFQIFVVT